MKTENKYFLLSKKGLRKGKKEPARLGSMISETAKSKKASFRNLKTYEENRKDCKFVNTKY